MALEGNGLALVGFLHRADSIAPQFRPCLQSVVLRDAFTRQRLLGELDRESSANIAGARCAMVREFLAHPKQPEWLWMVDSDMTFAEDILERLIATAERHGPIVGGLCFMVRPLHERFNAVRAAPLQLMPTLYTLNDEGRMLHWGGYPPNSVVQVHSTGAACLLIHRSVLADPRWLEDGHPQPWFRESVLHGRACSEDQFFCVRAGSFGYPIHVDTAAKTGHVKTFVADEDLYLEHRRTRYVPPPATERCTVLVPTVRPGNAERFMRSLCASSGLVNARAICSDDETAEAWKAAGAAVQRVADDRVSWMCKLNDAVQAPILTPWVFLVGDDVAFHAGWWDQAMDVAQRTGAKVIGTNDLGNPRCLAGDWSTHQVIATDYIATYGASWDGPGTVCHEGLRYWYADDEVVAVAKQRGVWAMALGSVVEHLHPIWGKGESDRWYADHERHVENDRRIFAERIARFAGEQVWA